MRQPESIRQVMEVLRKIHNMPDIPGTFNVFRMISGYSEIARRYQVAFPKNFYWLVERMQAAEKALRLRPLTPQPVS